MPPSKWFKDHGKVEQRRKDRSLAQVTMAELAADMLFWHFLSLLLSTTALCFSDWFTLIDWDQHELGSLHSCSQC